MKKIKLTQGKYAYLDDKDFVIQSKFNWILRKHRYTFYVFRWVKGKRVHLHKEILGKIPRGKTEIDHIDGDGLNNCRKNLMFVTNHENQRKRKLNKNNTSGHKGIYWNKRLKKWQAYGYINYKSIYIGVFSKIEDAIKAREKFTRLNYK